MCTICSLQCIALLQIADLCWLMDAVEACASLCAYIIM